MKNTTLRQLLTQTLVGQKVRLSGVKEGFDAQSNPILLVSLKPSNDWTLGTIEKVTFDRVMNVTNLTINLVNPKGTAQVVLTADEKFTLEND